MSDQRAPAYDEECSAGDAEVDAAGMLWNVAECRCGLRNATERLSLCSSALLS